MKSSSDSGSSVTWRRSCPSMNLGIPTYMDASRVASELSKF
jgi:hypothetical protein